jgi:hypothetical protein
MLCIKKIRKNNEEAHFFHLNSCLQCGQTPVPFKKNWRFLLSHLEHMNCLCFIFDLGNGGLAL